MSVYPFIEAEKVAERNVASACALMEVSRSAFYGWHHHHPGPRALEDAKLEAKIVEIHAKSRATYGSPRITAALAREGEGVGESVWPASWRCAASPAVVRRRKIRTTIPDPEANTTMVEPNRPFRCPRRCPLAVENLGFCTPTRRRDRAGRHLRGGRTPECFPAHDVSMVLLLPPG